ncbi:MAG: hypothetical protein IKQ63_10105 [Eubacterium sp.]|nr:hypothetical protein [Eubacterium sp.]
MGIEGKDKDVTLDIDDAIDNIFTEKKPKKEQITELSSLVDPLGEAGTTVLTAEMLDFENDKPETPQAAKAGFVSADAPKKEEAKPVPPMPNGVKPNVFVPNGPMPNGQVPPMQGGPRPNGPMPNGPVPPMPNGVKPNGFVPNGPMPNGPVPPMQGGPRPNGPMPNGPVPPIQGGPRPNGPMPNGPVPPMQGGPRPNGPVPNGPMPNGSTPSGLKMNVPSPTGALQGNAPQGGTGALAGGTGALPGGTGALQRGTGALAGGTGTLPGGTGNLTQFPQPNGSKSGNSDGKGLKIAGLVSMIAAIAGLIAVGVLLAINLFFSDYAKNYKGAADKGVTAVSAAEESLDNAETPDSTEE